MYRYKNRSFPTFQAMKDFMDTETDAPQQARMLHFTGWSLIGCAFLLGLFWILYLLVKHAL